MHYTDGTPAQVGDVVRGKGYNLKGPDGQLREIIGTVVSITPGAQTCNCVVVVTEVKDIPDSPYAGIKDAFSQAFDYHAKAGTLYFQNCSRSTHHLIRTHIEYGQCDHFELLSRAPGSAPQPPAAAIPAAAA